MKERHDAESEYAQISPPPGSLDLVQTGPGLLDAAADASASELDQLIAEQAKDMRTGHRVWSKSVDEFASGADIVYAEKPRLKVTDDRHGTLYGAKALKCKCARCRQASADYQRDYNRRKGTKTKFVCACCGSTDVRRVPRG